MCRQPDPCTIRELGQPDVDAIRELYAQLDQHDGYYRFFAPPPHDLTPVAQTAVARDGHHRAVGAFDGGRLIGAANYIDLEAGHAAEVAIVVAHDQQLHGIGTRLLLRLIDLARAEGFQQLVADVLTENSRVMQMIFEAPYPVSVAHDGAVLHVAIHIDCPLDEHVPGLLDITR